MKKVALFLAVLMGGESLYSSVSKIINNTPVQYEAVDNKGTKYTIKPYETKEVYLGHGIDEFTVNLSPTGFLLPGSKQNPKKTLVTWQKDASPQNAWQTFKKQVQASGGWFLDNRMEYLTQYNPLGAADASQWEKEYLGGDITVKQSMIEQVPGRYLWKVNFQNGRGETNKGLMDVTDTPHIVAGVKKVAEKVIQEGSYYDLILTINWPTKQKVFNLQVTKK